VHLSSGDLLRKEIADDTQLGRTVSKIMSSGQLVSSAIMVALMKKQMKDHPGKRVLLVSTNIELGCGSKSLYIVRINLTLCL